MLIIVLKGRAIMTEAENAAFVRGVMDAFNGFGRVGTLTVQDLIQDVHLYFLEHADEFGGVAEKSLHYISAKRRALNILRTALRKQLAQQSAMNGMIYGGPSEYVPGRKVDLPREIDDLCDEISEDRSAARLSFGFELLNNP